MKYRVIAEDSRLNLQNTINEHLEIGWKLQGGVSVSYHSGFKELWTQAIVKYELNDER
jgi:hypothetical protein